MNKNKLIIIRQVFLRCLEVWHIPFEELQDDLAFVDIDVSFC